MSTTRRLWKLRQEPKNRDEAKAKQEEERIAKLVAKSPLKSPVKAPGVVDATPTPEVEDELGVRDLSKSPSGRKLPADREAAIAQQVSSEQARKEAKAANKLYKQRGDGKTGNRLSSTFAEEGSSSSQVAKGSSESAKAKAKDVDGRKKRRDKSKREEKDVTSQRPLKRLFKKDNDEAAGSPNLGQGVFPGGSDASIYKAFVADGGSEPSITGSTEAEDNSTLPDGQPAAELSAAQAERLYDVPEQQLKKCKTDGQQKKNTTDGRRTRGSTQMQARSNPRPNIHVLSAQRKCIVREVQELNAQYEELLKYM